MIHSFARLYQFSYNKVARKCKPNSENSMLFIRANYVSVDYYFKVQVAKLSYQVNVVSTSRLEILCYTKKW